MFRRPLHSISVRLPRGFAVPEQFHTPLQNVSHTPGQNAAIRFFDPHSSEDLIAMREILRGKMVKKWMDDVNQISQTDYREWAGAESDTSFLFAVLDARVADPEQMQEVRGFVYIYSEREEKFRVKRMERQGFLAPAVGERYAMEVSFAVRPQVNGEQLGSGLMSSALRQACLQVELLLSSQESPEVELFAFTDPENYPAQRTLESSGFVNRGKMKYDWDSYEYSNLYLLNWRLLQRKVRARLLEVLQQPPTNNLG